MGRLAVPQTRAQLALQLAGGVAGHAAGKWLQSGLAKKKKQSQPKKKAAVSRFGRGGCIFDPTCMRVPGTITYVSDAVRFPNTWRASTTTSTTNTSVWLFMLTGTSRSIGVSFQDAVTPPPITVHQMTFGETATSETGAYEGRPGRFSVSLTNYTKKLDRGGSMYYLLTDQKLPAPPGGMTGTGWAASDVDFIADNIRKCPRTKRVDLDEFHVTQSVYSCPADSASYNEFVPYSTADTASVLLSRLLESQSAVTERSMPMRFLAIVFDPTSVAQNLALEFNGMQWLRFPQTDAMSMQAVQLPITPIAEFNAHAQYAAVDGGTFRPARVSKG